MLIKDHRGKNILEFSEPCKPFYIYMNARNNYKLTKKRIVAARDFHGKTKIYKSVAKSNNNIKINQSIIQVKNEGSHCVVWKRAVRLELK